MRRVVVTGLGLVTPLGFHVDRVWEQLCKGACAVRHIADGDKDKVAGIHAVAVVERSEALQQMFRERGIHHPSSSTSDFIDFALLASDLALEHAGLPLSNANMDRVGVSIGIVIFSLETIAVMTIRLLYRFGNGVSIWCVCL